MTVGHRVGISPWAGRWLSEMSVVSCRRGCVMSHSPPAFVLGASLRGATARGRGAGGAAGTGRNGAPVRSVWPHMASLKGAIPMTTIGWPSSLGQLTMFAECSPAELRAVASLVTGVRVPAEHVLMREGAAGREAMFIVDGTARVVRQDRDVATLARGDVIGEMALSGDGLRSATVTALTPVTAYVCNPSEFAGVRGVAPSVDRMITTTVERRTNANRVSRRRRDGFRRGRRWSGSAGVWRAVELPGRGTTYAVDLAGPSPTGGHRGVAPRIDDDRDAQLGAVPERVE